MRWRPHFSDSVGRSQLYEFEERKCFYCVPVTWLLVSVLCREFFPPKVPINQCKDSGSKHCNVTCMESAEATRAPCRDLALRQQGEVWSTDTLPAGTSILQRWRTVSSESAAHCWSACFLPLCTHTQTYTHTERGVKRRGNLGFAVSSSSERLLLFSFFFLLFPKSQPSSSRALMIHPDHWFQLCLFVKPVS